MTPQTLADRSEALALQRYLVMRDAWAPCWGRTRPGGRRLPASRVKGPAGPPGSPSPG